MPPVIYQLQFLTGRRLAVFLAVAARIVPEGGGLPGGNSLATAGVVDWALARMEPGLRKKFLFLLWVVEFLGIFFGGRFFTKNPDRAKDRQLAWMESGPVGLLRMGFFGLKNFACMGVFTREDAWEAMGYEGPLDRDRPFPDPAIRALARGEAEVIA
ncbi:MAG: hypothetical protein ABIM40_10015 [Pseudomonadota bacterium]